MIFSPKDILGIEILKNDEYPEWDNFVEKCKRATVYHLSCWGRAITKVYKHEYIIAVAKDSSGGIIGGIPVVRIKRKIYSVPFATNAGFCGSNKDVKIKLTMYLLDITGCEFIELREYNDSTSDIHENGMVTQTLNLAPGADKIWQQIGSSVRARVKKAEKAGLSVSVGRGELNAFYKIFAKKMHSFGTPVHSEEFFKWLLEYGLDNITLIMIKRNSIVIGGAILGWVGGNLFDPWIVTDDKYKQYCPNDLLYWSIIKWACEKDLSYFDMGRSQKASGVYRFKKKWCAEDMQLSYKRVYPDRKSMVLNKHVADTIIAKVFTNIWKRLPVFVSNSFGPHLRKYIT